MSIFGPDVHTKTESPAEGFKRARLDSADADFKHLADECDSDHQAIFRNKLFTNKKEAIKVKNALEKFATESDESEDPPKVFLEKGMIVKGDDWKPTELDEAVSYAVGYENGNPMDFWNEKAKDMNIS